MFIFNKLAATFVDRLASDGEEQQANSVHFQPPGGPESLHRCFFVSGAGTKSYFCQSRMAELKVLQFVLLFPGGH